MPNYRASRVISNARWPGVTISYSLLPHFLTYLLEENRYKIVLAERQNWYHDLSFISMDDESVKFAIDFKTTYRDPEFPGHVNGFTLGSHGAYFVNRNSTKNIQFPYNDYAGHYCLGIIYSRLVSEEIDEMNIINVEELNDDDVIIKKIGHREVTQVKNLKSITSVIKDFQFFVCEKWQLASDRQGSGNTANIGSITYIEDIIKGNGMFAKLGEDWFDEYWMNYGQATMKVNRKTVKIKRLDDFLKFKGKNTSLIVPVKTKKRISDDL